MGRAVRIIGAPTDFGSNRRGVDMGPSAIRYAGLIEGIESTGADCTDVGDVRVPHVRRHGGDREDPVPNAKHLDQIAEVSTRIADEVADAREEGALPIVVGGDHSLAIGTVAGAARDADLGLLWFDAHGDYNTPETSPSGNVHGMPLAASLGRGAFADMDWARADGLREKNVVWVGLRSLDDAEREAIREGDATAYTMADIDERGINDLVEEALEVATSGVDGLHVSLDLDWLDPRIAPGVGTPVRGGVTYREAHSAMETVADWDRATGDLHSFEVVEVNPILDSHNETAELATELTASAVGKRVL
ncbi:arginase [Halobacteriales archaeon QS_1_68_20]|nr:MAG: arginase [Halobacteriales archaeon QS_1_68_20]